MPSLALIPKPEPTPPMIIDVPNASHSTLRRLNLLLSEPYARKSVRLRVAMEAILSPHHVADTLESLVALSPQRRRLISILRILVSKGVSIRLTLPSAEPSVADGDLLAILQELIPRLEVETTDQPGGKPRPAK